MKKLALAFTRMWELYTPFHGAFLSLTAVLVMVQAVSLLTPYFVGQLIDGLTQHAEREKVMYCAWLIFGAKILETAFTFLITYVHVRYLDFRVTEYLCIETLKKISRLSIGQIINENSGYRQSVITKGERAVQDIMDLLFSDLMPAAARALVTMIGLFYLSPLISAVVFVSSLLYIAVSFIINHNMRGQIREFRKLDSKLDKDYSEIMRNMRLVMVNAQEDRMVREYGAQCSAYSTFAEKMWVKYNVKATILREPISAISLLITIIACIVMVYDKGYSAGQIVTAVSWTLMLWSTLTKIGPYQRRLTFWQTLANRYFEMLEMPTAVPTAKNPTRPKEFQGRIEFRNTSFSYPFYKKIDDDEGDGEELRGVLHDVSFTIEPGETCAVVGHSGAGKSTLMHLLLRAYDPDKGEIYIDGVDLRLLDPQLIRKGIGYVEQEVKLWDQTLRYNMLYSLNGEAHKVTDLEMECIAEKAGISRFYSRLGEKKFEALIGENGVKLSGGERQRVGIARALAKSPKILIFDEATNSLDTKNDALVQKAMRQSLQGRTGLIIAHRLSTIRHADKIIVLEQGKLVGAGTHNELVGSCPAYCELVECEREALNAS
ncbi:MAG TPA: ABC transporter ATP-binding protein [Candidatus Paceibacterota bacterium]